MTATAEGTGPVVTLRIAVGAAGGQTGEAVVRVRFADPFPTDVMVDGEVLELTLRELRVLPGALRVIV